MSDEQFQTARGIITTRLFTPQSQNASRKLAVFTHPWAPFGGSMHDPVLQMLKSLFINSDFHVLVYNSCFSFTGLGEVQDQEELTRATIQRLGGKVEHLVLLGYSHGSLVASMHPILPGSESIKTSHILLSYPLSVRGLITFFRGSMYETGLRSLLDTPSSNVFILYGDQDQFTAVQRYENWLSDLKKISRGELVARRIDGGDHFWANTASRSLCEAVSKWLSSQEAGKSHIRLFEGDAE